MSKLECLCREKQVGHRSVRFPLSSNVEMHKRQEFDMLRNDADDTGQTHPIPMGEWDMLYASEQFF